MTMNNVINRITRDESLMLKTRIILTDELLTHLYGNRYLCRQKVMNLIYLFEYHLSLTEINGVYYRTLSGPANYHMLDEIEQTLKNIGWSKTKEVESESLYRSYIRTDEWQDINYTELELEQDWQEKVSEIRRFAKVMKPMTNEDTMMITTVYAAWNDLKLSGISFSDNDILRSIMDDWNMTYHQISRFNWRKTLAWLRSAEILPRGNGRKTIPLNHKSN